MLEFKECPEPDEFAREKGRKLFAGNVDFLKGVVDMNGLPLSLIHISEPTRPY